MRIGKSGWLLLAVLALLAWHYWPRALGLAESAMDHNVYYRLLAKYQHGDEIIDFDIVVGCNVNVTRYGNGDKSYDAFRDPVIFAKAAKDGGAIWQIVPNACGGETSANGRVPTDLLPGAIWFQDANDFSFGIAYVTQDAFERTGSDLRFLGASISSAARNEWQAFQPIAATNLIDPRPFTDVLPPPSESDVSAHLWDHPMLAKWWLSDMECRGVARYSLSKETDRALVRKYWPDSRPRFWMPHRLELDEIAQAIDLYGAATADGVPGREIFNLGHYVAEGFATRDRGGMLRSGQPWSKAPQVIFPMRADDGVPWAHAGLADAPTIYRDVELNEGTNRGLAYCYALLWGKGKAGSLHMPNYFEKTFITRIDGEQLYGEDVNDTSPLFRPDTYFERDEYVYLRFSFGLH